MKCPSVNETGLACQKLMYHAQNGEWWDHAGGHLYATEETMHNLETKHFDARALLAGEKVTFHAPEECIKEGYCAWR